MTMLLTKEVILSQLESNEEFPIALSDAWEWLGYTKKEHAKDSFLSLGLAEDVDFETSETRSQREPGIIPEERYNSRRGPKTKDLFMTVDAFKGWGMSAHTERGKEVRANYIRIEKEWRILKAYHSQSGREVMPEDVQRKHVKATEYLDSPFHKSFEQEEPEAAEVVKHWNYLEVHKKLPPNLAAPAPVQQLTPIEVPQRIIPNSSEFMPDPEAQKMIEKLLEIIDQMSLAANRAGLAGNKSIKEAEFLAKQLDKVREFFGDQESKIERLNNALKDSELLIADQSAQIERLQKELKIANAVTESANAKTDGYEAVHRSHKMEISQLKSKITDLEMQLQLQNTAPTLTISSGNGNRFLGLPPAT